MPGLVLACFFVCASAHAQMHVVAHQGYWDTEGGAHNSLASLRAAAALGCWGSEFDVMLTSDDIPVVHHNVKHGDVNIQTSPLSALQDFCLENGEPIPTLESYLQEALKLPALHLVLEIKAHADSLRDVQAAQVITAMVERYGLASRTHYIAFSQTVCDAIHRLVPEADNAYLGGDMTPKEVAARGWNGIDYRHDILLKKHPDWARQAQRLKLDVNIWTVDDADVLLLQLATVPYYDYITTNNPKAIVHLQGNMRGLPYLQNPSSTAITVMYQTHRSCHSWVEYGVDTTQCQSARQLTGGQEVVHDANHRVRLEGLQAGTPYYYRVCTQALRLNEAYATTFGEVQYTPWYHFTLPTPGCKDYTAIVLNDMHSRASAMDAMARVAATVDYDFVIFNGDCLPEPARPEDGMQAMQDLITRFDCANHPCVFIRGNHEIRNAWSSGFPSLWETASGKTYGAFTWGDTRFVILDLGEDKPDTTPVYAGLNDFDAFRHEQVTFLQEELSSKAFRQARHHVLVHHIPIWGNTDEYQPCTPLWEPVLQKAPFDFDLCGHTHRYREHATGEVGNPFPVYIGNGPGDPVMFVLTNRGGKLSIEKKK